MKIKITLLCLLIGAANYALSQSDDSTRQSVLQEVSVSAGRERITRMAGAVNGSEIGQAELFRAACCNLGESFVSNPSVDVNYNDAAVGSKQIRLLGLGGEYVQMLCEGLPMATGVAQPYQLGWVPGSWMKSISVSKGTASVKHGPQSVTGQINVEYLKPEDEPSLQLNLYTDSRLKTEGNLMGNYRFNPHLSSILMAHYEKEWMHHDENGDGWIDLPAVEQLNVSNRWKYQRGRYIMHAGISLLSDTRHGGEHHSLDSSRTAAIHTVSHRLEGYMKHAYLLNAEHNTNLALTANASLLDLDGTMLEKNNGVQQRTLHAKLMLEHEFADAHALSTGISMMTEQLDEDGSQPLIDIILGIQRDERETLLGAYAEYTFKPSYRFTAMAGLRADRSSYFSQIYLTPRVHLKWVPTDWLTLRASAGKGHRTAHPLAEYHYLLTSGRSLQVEAPMMHEEAWNTGASAIFYVPVGDRTLTLSAEYFYTHFVQQVVVDYDVASDVIRLHSLQGKSFSHTLQLEANYQPDDEWTLMAALRLNDVRCTYDGILKEKPLQSRYKALFTLGWEPLMALWHFDLTLQLNGSGRMPTPYTLADGSPSWDETFPAYPQLNFQLTRDFRHCSVYAGVENLTGFVQKVPVIDAAHPFSTSFDPTLVWGPVHGRMYYAGIRLKI